MRTNLPEKLENGRLRTGELASEFRRGGRMAHFLSSAHAARNSK